MKSSSFVFGRGSFLQKTLAAFAILAVLTLTVPMQAFADPSTDPAVESGTPASTDLTPPDPQDVSTSTDNTDKGTPPLLRTFSFISPEENTPGCKLVSDDVNTYIGTNPAVATYTHPVWSNQLNADGAKWIWNAYHVSDPTQPETVTFTRSFNVSNSPSTATLKIAADNSYTVAVNTVPVPACDGTGDSNFSSVDTCTIPVVSGSNTITFTATNAATPDNSDPESNPAGLYYEVNVTGASCTEVPPVKTSTVTMCKVSDADEQPLSGWQLYLKGSNVQDGLSVPSTNSSGVSSNSLVSGMQYLVTALGTWSNQNGANLVDAEYSTTDNWATHMDGYTGYQTDILELQINSAFDPNSNWGPYNNSHTYSQLFTAPSNGPANFRIFDGTGTTQNESWFGDNSGSLSVNIDNAYAGTTGANGCVTLKNVPYGTYTPGEIAQDGWTLTEVNGDDNSISEEGNSVVVNDPTETFAFINHHEVPQEQSCVITSDTTTLEGGEPSFIATFIHSAWTAVIDGASWIWGDPAITDPVNAQTQVFTKKFSLASAPVSDATLMIAADNSYSVKVNGIVVGSDPTEFNYTADGQDSITIPAADLHSGANTLEITVTNFAQGGGTQWTNPAGLKYKLTIGGTSCTQDAPTYKVHIFKYLDSGDGIAQVPNNSNAPLFPMIATYSIAGVGTNLNPGDGYVLGNGGGVGGSDNGLLWAANTIPLHAGDVYGTHEVTGGDSPVVANAKACSPGKYYLEGYKVGDSLLEAQSADLNDEAPSFSDFSSSKYVIVVNKKCADAPPPPGTVKVHIYKYLWNGDGYSQVPNGAEGLPHFTMFATWKASNLNGGATTSAAYDFGTGLGGAEFQYAAVTSPMNGGANYVTQEATFGDRQVVPNVGQCSPGKYYLAGYQTGSSLGEAQSATATTTAPAFYGLTSDQYVIVKNHACPSGNDGGHEGGNTGTLTIVKDTSGGDGQFTFNIDGSNESHTSTQVTTSSGVGTSSVQLVNGTYSVTEAATDGWTYNSVSCSYDGENIGNIIPNGESITIVNGHHVTCTFHNTKNAIIPFVTFGTGGGGGGGQGKVLGVSTTTQGQVLGATCTPILTSFLAIGKKNPTDQVIVLQNFLNGNLGITLPVTGFFGPLTFKAVKDFQTKYFSDVLSPWVPFGLPSDHTPTGYVYKTTQWMVNHIACSEADGPKPKLP